MIQTQTLEQAVPVVDFHIARTPFCFVIGNKCTKWQLEKRVHRYPSGVNGRYSCRRHNSHFFGAMLAYISQKGCLTSTRFTCQKNRLVGLTNILHREVKIRIRGFDNRHGCKVRIWELMMGQFCCDPLGAFFSAEAETKPRATLLLQALIRLHSFHQNN